MTTDKECNTEDKLHSDVTFNKGWTQKWGKYFLPWRFSFSDRKKLEQFENNGVIQMLLFLWILPLIKRGLNKVLCIDDLGVISEELEAKHTLKKLKEYLNKKADNVSLLRIYFSFCSSKMWFYFLFFGSGQVAHFMACAMVTRQLFEYLDSPVHDLSQGLTLVVALVFLLVWTSLAKQQGLFLACRIAVYAKSAFLGLIYEKSLKIKSAGTKSVGEFVNLSSNDATRIYESSLFFISLIVSPIQILVNTIFLAFYFGPSSLVGSGILIAYLPVSVMLGKAHARLRKYVVSNSDERVKMIAEAITYVKLIKMYAWENSFAKKIYKLRHKERKSIQTMAYVQALAFGSSFIISNISTVVTIFVAVYVGEDVSLPKTFTMLTLFSLTSALLGIGQRAVRRFAEVVISFKRLNLFLQLEERGREFKECIYKENAIEVENASFTWKQKTVLRNTEQRETENDEIDNHCVEKEKLVNTSEIEDKTLTPILYDITLNVKKSALIGVSGPVGCGKSSLLQALLNEMEVIGGKCRLNNSIGYTPQQPWIMHDTIRENILFGEKFDKNLYDAVCNACALEADIKSMPSGDLTEIGERGLNLSGGQKQRISLARALYANKDLYLLDDPLSAVDSHVGSHIFKRCILSAMKEKTVVMVTHHLQYLKDCDYVIYMKDGRFQEEGTYEQLINNDSGFADDMKKYTFEKKSKEKEEDTESEDNENLGQLEDDGKNEEELFENNVELKEKEDDQLLLVKGKTVTAEARESGAVALKIYVAFFKFCGGFLAVLVIFGFNIGSVALQISSDYWLSYWIKQRDAALRSTFLKSGNLTSPTLNSSLAPNTTMDGDNYAVTIDTDYYMIIYCILALGMIISTILASLLTVLILLRGSTFLHNALFDALFKSPMQFFDTTPSGRLLNCMSKDVDEIDSYLPNLFINTIRYLSLSFGLLIFVAIGVPWFLIPLFLFTICLWFLSKAFRTVVREIKRIENITRSPVYSHIAATIQGIMSIRSYAKQQHYTRIFQDLLNKNMVALFFFDATQRWFGVNVDMLSNICVLATGITVVLLKGQIPAAIGALCISFSIQVLGKMQFSMRLFAEVEARFTSVERLTQYIRTLIPEGDFNTKKEVNKEWPKDGSISFDAVSLRYREELPLVLKDFTIEIKDKEKIGIVGRTGAGKSSIGVILYRLVNPQHGTIKIAGVDTQQIGLHDLRKELTIIPQDPVLFIGTIRYNLDPFDQYGDGEIWTSLEKAHIKDMVSSLPMKLHSDVHENGQNFSVGERQLMCLARAALRKTKILMLDEATASIDANSDSKIQQTIKESFADCTILTIAHRLNTIMHCDRIIVMDKGKVVECDSPSNLLTADSRFKDIARAAHVNMDI